MPALEVSQKVVSQKVVLSRGVRRMRAGMASDGIVTVLTQYLQLKLGYVTSDQARSCSQ